MRRLIARIDKFAFTLSLFVGLVVGARVSNASYYDSSQPDHYVIGPILGICVFAAFYFAVTEPQQSHSQDADSDK